jgi:hypothetical protein
MKHEAESSSEPLSCSARHQVGSWPRGSPRCQDYQKFSCGVVGAPRKKQTGPSHTTPLGLSFLICKVGATLSW